MSIEDGVYQNLVMMESHMEETAQKKGATEEDSLSSDSEDKETSNKSIWRFSNNHSL